MKKEISIEFKIYNIINFISSIAAIITCTLLVVLGFFRYHLIDRVSLRIQGFIALIDIFRHLSQRNLTDPNEIICQLIGYSIRVSNHLYLLLNVAIALNLHRLTIQNKRPRKRLQWLYGSFSAILAVFINIVPLAEEKFGRNRNGSCRFIDDESTKWWNIPLIYLMNLPGVIYCLVIFILVSLKVYYKKQNFNFIRGSEGYFGQNPTKFLWTLYFRISLYPLTCFITLFPFTLLKLFIDASKINPFFLNSISFFCLRITGTLNFITLTCDPHFQIAAKTLWQYLLALKSRQSTQVNDEQLTLEKDKIVSIPSHDELEYPNGDRILLQDYIRLL